MPEKDIKQLRDEWMEEVRDAYARGREVGYKAGQRAADEQRILTVPIAPDGSRVEMWFSRQLSPDEWDRFLQLVHLWRVGLVDETPNSGSTSETGGK